MPFSRRRFALASAVSLLGTAGCSGSVDADSLQEVHLVLSNRTDESQTFHFALEADDGLGQWHDFELAAAGYREVVIEPESEREWTGFHAVAGDNQVSGTLLGQGDEQTCLQLNYRITEDEIHATMSTNQSLCES
ncbi:hypothetical protein [Natrinema longum]|uniref:Lipoprotein n=1 Tax=Natrinema longum TaxID=370324 RepID=A0A8A2UCB9_9EURY|nr:hypothetical protein [Natrinema longum]MBZ6495917.1 hypothetical protein [Natrinema longum]QSW86142.1 hypothetical protein J0X27_04795 [Natrinema longum]